jgi:hypothetical protein
MQDAASHDAVCVFSIYQLLPHTMLLLLLLLAPAASML